MPAPQLTYTVSPQSCTTAPAFGFGIEYAFPVEVEDFVGGLTVCFRRSRGTEPVLLRSDSDRIEVEKEE